MTEEPRVTPITRQSRFQVKCPSPSKLVWSSPLTTNAANGDCASVVMKHSWCEEQCQEVEADFLAKSKDDFGNPRHHYSFCPTDSRGKPMSTARFLPTKEEKLEDFLWTINIDSKPPSLPQCRSLWIHVSKPVSQSLVHAKTPWDLFVAIGHGMLGACRSWLQISRRLTC